MGDLQGIFGFLVLVLVGLIVFAIYFIFKVLQFVIQAINLYKDMVSRQNAMIKILKDIRDQTKVSTSSRVLSKNSRNTNFDNKYHVLCPHCKTKTKKWREVCSNCGKKILTAEEKKKEYKNLFAHLDEKEKLNKDPVAANKVIICPYCDTKNYEMNKDCSNCGESISTDNTDSESNHHEWRL